MEPFEITEDDLRAEAFALGMRRGKKRRNPKDEAAYGIFADDEDQEQQQTKGKGKKYSGPLKFVSGGITGDKDKSEVDEDGMDVDSSDKDSDHSDVEMEENTRPSFGSSSTKKVDPSFGKWEQHTTGFGSKMLQKMGWKHGEGLGTEKKGLAAPIEVKVRPKGMGLAFGEFDELPEVEKRKKQKEEDDTVLAARKAEIVERKSGWKKGKKPKVVYKTVEEIMAEEGVQQAPMKIFDMRGPEVRELDSFEGLQSLSSSTESLQPKPLAELRYNVGLLVERNEKMLHNYAKGIKELESERQYLQKQRDELDQQLSVVPNEIDRLKSVYRILQELSARSKKALRAKSADEAANVELYQDLISQILNEYYEEFKTYSLDRGFVAFLSPILKKLYLRWNPLESPNTGVTVFEQWRKLLQTEKRDEGTADSMDAYGSMIFHTWFPSVRSSISNNWNPRDPDRLINFLEIWKPHVPAYILSNVVHQLVMPKLRKAIDDWNPKQPEPLHSWIYPWLPVLKDSMEPMFSNIRYKISALLQYWSPKDPIGFDLIQPWKVLFSERDMDTLMKKLIIPKLSNYLLHEFTIDPRKQNLQPLQDVLKWTTIAPIDSMITVLETGFFHKWLHTLYRWLSAPNKNQEFYDQITKWYTEWKSVFPEAIRGHPTFQARSRTALNMMNYCIDNGLVKGFANDMYASAKPTAPKPKPTETASLSSIKRPKVTFRDVVEYFAANNNLLFVPTQKRTEAGKQIFDLGNIKVYIEDDVLYAETVRGSSNYFPTSLDSVLDLQSA